MARETVDITPKVLKWARLSAGFSVEDVAKRVGVKAAYVVGWEDGTIGVTAGRLDLLADIYKRPTAIFYLPDPPDEPTTEVPDFRAKKGAQKTPELRFQIRRARERREAAVALHGDLGVEPPNFAFRCSLNDDPRAVGTKLRDALAITVEEQRAWRADKSGYKAFGGWKATVEDRGVLVFQASRKQLGESRGFSLSADTLPVVEVSSEDVPVGRAFTLMHELAHLGLRQGGICDLHDDGIEAFCNKVAAAVLMPEAALRHAVREVGRVAGRPWSDEQIAKLAREFSVSPQALVLRLIDVGEASWEYYRSRRAEFEMRAKAAAGSAGDKNKAIPQHVQAIARNGRRFTQLVLDAYHRGVITAHSAAGHLDVGFKWVPEIERDMARHAWRDAS
jgi:Zn-dependent peptidase ImmA (M78 family)